MKRPLVVGLLNFFLPGLGYIILGKRIVFGWLILVSGVGLVILSFAYDTGGEMTTPDIIGAALSILMSFAFAYDAYQIAQEEAGV